jgi:hypothetical protein
VNGIFGDSFLEIKPWDFSWNFSSQRVIEKKAFY